MVKKRKQTYTDADIADAKALVTKYLLEYNQDKAYGDTPRAEQSYGLALAAAARVDIPCRIYGGEDKGPDHG